MARCVGLVVGWLMLLAADLAGAQHGCIAIGQTSLTCVDDGSGDYSYQLTLVNEGTTTLAFAFFIGDPILPAGISFQPEMADSLGLAPGGSVVLETVIRGAQLGEQLCYMLTAHDETLMLCCGISICLDIPGCEPAYRRCNCNADASFNIADPIYLLGYLFASGPVPSCSDACDCNDDGTLNIADAVSMLAVLFSGGAPPAPPFPGCGPDPSADALTCISFPPCP